MRASSDIEASGRCLELGSARGCDVRNAYGDQHRADDAHDLACLSGVSFREVTLYAGL